ncbi:MAG: hypothetical protein FWE54_00900 [Methanimicrococcus sp.]|nr:hypothetical protein [Methanimicrococcus sp.]
MVKKTFYSALSVFLILILAVSLFSGTASASSPGLKITLVDQTPYPVQAGQQVRFWIQAENIGSGPMNNVTIEVVPDGIFSASAHDISRTYSTIHSGTKVYHEYIMFVASDAPDGPRDLTVRHKVGNSTLWIEQKFTIGIGGIIDPSSRGTLIIEKVSSSPEVFMPGDTGIIWVTLKNNATAMTAGSNTTNARIQSADLYSKDNIIVTSEAVNALGIIAPGDNISIPFRVSIPEDTADGTYLLMLGVNGSSFEYNIKRNIEIKVDAAGIRTIQSKAPYASAAGKTVEIDIVNYHQGTVRGVSIIPIAEGMTFYPTEYFIGEMKPDDFFTAKFNITQGAGNSSVEFKAVYFNGDNAHEDSMIFDIGPAITPPSKVMTFVIYLAIILLLAAVVGHFYLKKKKNMSLLEYLKKGRKQTEKKE